MIEKSRPEHDTNLTRYAIRCRPEAAGDVISGENLDNVDGYVVLDAASDSGFQENQNQPFA